MERRQPGRRRFGKSSGVRDWEGARWPRQEWRPESLRGLQFAQRGKHWGLGQRCAEQQSVRKPKDVRCPGPALKPNRQKARSATKDQQASRPRFYWEPNGGGAPCESHRLRYRL